MSKNQKTIFVDGLPLVDGFFTGIGQYTLGIMRGFDEIIAEQISKGEEPLRVRVVLPRDGVKKFLKFQFRNIDYVRLPIPHRYMAALWRRNLLPPLDLFLGSGIYLFMNFVSMRLAYSKSLVVIYDLSYELHREYSDEGNARFLSAAVERTVRGTDKIITISQSAKREIVEVYGVKDSFVDVAYPAIDRSLLYRRTDEEIRKVKEKYRLGSGKYILALSSLEPRKNLVTLVDAYCALPKSIRAEYALLLVGVNGWKIDKLFDHIIDKVKKGHNITRPSKYIDDKDKPAILSGASVLVYPSHYEGFGMPHLKRLHAARRLSRPTTRLCPKLSEMLGLCWTA